MNSEKQQIIDILVKYDVKNKNQIATEIVAILGEKEEGIKSQKSSTFR